MKKHLLYFFVLAMAFTACRKDDTKPINGNVDERVTKTLSEYQSQLAGAQYGWKAVVFPSEGYGFGHFFKFDDKNRVIMYSDWDGDTETTGLESSYRLKALQQPTLLFDTYSYLHILQDPNPANNGGETGQGWYADFEFRFESSTADTMKLVGIFNKSPLVLVRATKEEYEAYNASGLADMDEATEAFVNAPGYRYVDFGNGIKVQCEISTGSRSFSLTWVNKDGSIGTLSTPWGYFVKSVFLKESLTYNGVSFNEVFWDDAKELFYIKAGGKIYEFQTSTSPLIPFHILLGTSYKVINVPSATTYPGWGNDFITRKALANQRTQNSVVVGGNPVSLGAMRFTFNAALKTMVLVWNAPFTGGAINLTYPYTYTKTEAGIYKFTIGSEFDGNSTFIYTNANKLINPILQERINVDTFRLDYFINPTTGAVLGQFISIEHPDFSFTGTL